MGRTGFAVAAGGWLLLAGSLSACDWDEVKRDEEALGCELADACGGDLVGEWYAVGETSCVEPSAAEPVDTPCAGLTFHATERTRVTGLDVDLSGLSLASVRLKYTESGAYAAGFSHRATKQLRLDQDCLTPELPAPACTAVAISVQTYLQNEGLGTNVSCEERGEGCDCTYDVVQVTGFTGSYALEGATAKHTPAADTGDEVEHSYCATSQRLTLGPSPDAPGLFGSPELRLLRFERLDCRDGKRQAHEEGVDCGAVCGSDCGS